MNNLLNQSIAIDTNILIRFFVADDEVQYHKALNLLETVDSFFVPITVFVEVVWVLTQRYGLSKTDVCMILTDFIHHAEKLCCDKDAILAGLEMLNNHGDFADMINAYLAKEQNYQTFVTFDKKASKKLNELGYQTLLL